MLNDGLGDMKESLKDMLDYSDRMHQEHRLMREVLEVIASDDTDHNQSYYYTEVKGIDIQQPGTFVQIIARYALERIEDA